MTADHTPGWLPRYLHSDTLLAHEDGLVDVSLVSDSEIAQVLTDPECLCWLGYWRTCSLKVGAAPETSTLKRK